MKLIDHGHGGRQVGVGEEATSVARGGGTVPELRRAGVSRLECIPGPGKGRQEGVEAEQRPRTPSWPLPTAAPRSSEKRLHSRAYTRGSPLALSLGAADAFAEVPVMVCAAGRA